MSILLSEEEWQGTRWEQPRDLIEIGIIHAVQYLEGKCIEHYSVFKSHGKQMYGHEGQFFMLRRIDCPDCMEQIHKELEQ
jgi:hypothetical protein